MSAIIQMVSKINQIQKKPTRNRNAKLFRDKQISMWIFEKCNCIDKWLVFYTKKSNGWLEKN